MSPTLPEQTSKISDPSDLHDMPAVRAPVFLPRLGRRPSASPYLYPAQHGGRPRTRTNTTERRRHGQRGRKRRERSTTTNTHEPPARRTTPRPTTEQGPSSRAEGQARATRREAEDENNKRVLNATGVENSRTMTPFRPVPPTQKQVNTLASPPPATHIRTVPKPSFTKRTM